MNINYCYLNLKLKSIFYSDIHSIMPRGVHTAKRPSGSQQRKAKEARTDSVERISGSMLQYVSRPSGSSTDTTCQPPNTSDTSTHSVEGQRVLEIEQSDVALTELEAEDQEVEMEGLGDVGDSGECDSSHETVNEINEVEGTDLEILRDVSYWEIPVPDNCWIEIIKRGSASFQNKDGPFSVAERQNPKAKGGVRQLSKEWFYKVMPHGENILRTWMVYSPVSKNLYCFCCRLFAVSATDMTSKFVTGFRKWWKLNPKVHVHETSEQHLLCLEKWKTLAAGLKLHKTIDANTVAEMELQKKKWRDILRRLLDIALFLAKQNLAFRGHKEDDVSLNKGNFLEMVEMLSKYDPVLKEHLMRLQADTCKLKASVSYLAPKTQNEFISALANHVKEKLVTEIQSAKYFGMMFDSTPDISHTDQMSQVIRYVKIENGKVEVKEVFLGFFSLKGKKAADLSFDIIRKLESDGLDIMMCRAQGYDNAATMAGIHGGVQAILKEKNKKAVFNGCVDHSLNLCGQHSFAENSLCVTFFGPLERMFAFFAASTHRWDVLIAHTEVSVKRLSTTRWSLSLIHI